MRFTVLISMLLTIASAAGAAETEVTVAYLEQRVIRPPTLSNLDPVPENLGRAGAELGLADNLTTGRFLGHSYELTHHEVPADGDFHAMRSDALAQLMRKKRWSRWALVAGTRPTDIAFAAALRGSARKFGLEITSEKNWAHDADLRRNASQEVPAFTQDLAPHDVLVIADELGDFGRYVIYNTTEPRPVAGSEGVTPRGWSPVVEQWGAAQLQSRFRDQSGRAMRSQDYAAWAALRTIGEAVTRTGSGEPAALRDYILSDAFELAGFKGRALSYRGWNGQLRQPVPLVHPRAVVALAPIEGFLHQLTELDTLGLDRSESACSAFGE